MNRIKKSRLVFGAILLAYLLYAALYIYKTSFIVDGERYFVLFDDAMISMRYARNLALGDGLVWNPGAERVEGYTNPLWVIFMAFFHLFPLPASKVSLFVQAGGAAFLIANLFFVRWIGERISGSQLVALLAVMLTAFYMPLNNWGLQGMEVSALALITGAALWICQENLRSQRFSAWLYVLLGIGTLVRVDMVILYVLILGFMVLADRPNRRQTLIWGAGLLVMFLAGQTVFRYGYYGDILPNTYYLKMNGYPVYLRLARGFYVLFQFIWSFNWLLFLLPFTILIFRRDRSVLLLFLVLLGQVAYSVYVGGDAWEHRGGSNRYFAMVMPVFFILFVYAAELLRAAFLSGAQNRSARVARLASLGLVVFVLMSMVNINLVQDFRSLERWVLLRQPVFIEGNKEYVRIARDLRKITSEQASIAVVSAGAIPYFSDRYAIDLLGKNDVKIAHQKVHGVESLFKVDEFRPGHMKWDYDYSIGLLKPDVVVQLWGKTEEAGPYIEQYYTGGGAGDGLFFSLRKDSPHIRWDQVQAMP